MGGLTRTLRPSPPLKQEQGEFPLYITLLFFFSLPPFFSTNFHNIRGTAFNNGTAVLGRR